MTDVEKTVLQNELQELHAYARMFFCLQMSWFIFVGSANVAALGVYFSETVSLEVTSKPPLCVGFVLLNLATAMQNFIRRLDYQVLGKQIDEIRQRLIGNGVEDPNASVFPLDWSQRSSGLYTLTTCVLAAVWGVCCLHVWRHDQLPIFIYQICFAVLLIGLLVFGIVLGRQLAQRRKQLRS